MKKGFLSNPVPAKSVAKQRKEYAPYHQKMIAMMNSDRYNLLDVINMLQAATKKLPDNIFLMLGIANIHFHMDEFDEAIALIDPAIKLVPTHPESYLLKSKSLAKQQKLKEAVETLEEGVRLIPDNSFLFNELSKVRAKLNRIANSRVREMQKVWEIQEEETIECVDLSPDCQFAAVAVVDGDIKIIDTLTGQTAHKLPGHALGNLVVAFSPAGTLLATSGQDGLVNLYNGSTFEKVGALNHKGEKERAKSVWVQKIAWVSESMIITCTNKIMRTWDTTICKIVKEYDPHASTITDVAYNATAKQIATTSYCTVLLFDFEKSNPIRMAEWKGSLLTLSWSADAQWIAVATQDNAVVVWNMKSNGIFPVSDFDGMVKAVFDPTSKYLATTGSDILKIFDFSGPFGDEGFEDRPESSVMPIAELAHNDFVVDVSFHKSGIFMSSCSKDGVTFLWKTKEEIPVCTAKHTESAQSVKWVERDTKKYLLAIYADAKIISWTL